MQSMVRIWPDGLFDVSKDILMPHVIVKMFAGRSEADKKRLADQISLAVVNSIGASESSISVAVEELDPNEWTEKVYDPEIAARPEILYKKPGYQRF